MKRILFAILVLSASIASAQVTIVPPGSSGSGGGDTLPVADTTEVVKGSSDATKKVRIEADGLTAGATRIITVPDNNTTLPVASYALTILGPTAARSFTLPDANATLARTDAAQTFTGVQTFLSAPSLSAGATVTTGVITMPATLGCGMTFAGDTTTCYGWRQSGILSMYAAGERMRIGSTAVQLLGADFYMLGAFNAATNLTFAGELVTLNTGGTSSVSSTTIPAGKIIAITYSVNNTITTATAFTIKMTGGNPFVSVGTATSSQTGLTAGATGTLVPAGFTDQFISAPTTVTITTTGTPGAGTVRFVVHYQTFIPNV